ncbi:MAG: hypothetical protein ACKVQV_02255 [Bacteroidia bacterium]
MILIVGLFFLLITLILIGLAYLVSRWLTKKGYKKTGITILTTVTISIVYFSYTAFYPTDSFYEDEFEDNTGLDFPLTGNILFKNASYPDQHGDYSATALFKVSKKDFNHILTAIQSDNKFLIDTTPFTFNLAISNTKIMENCFTKCYTLNGKDSDLNFTISFNDKDNLIEIQRDSW